MDRFLFTLKGHPWSVTAVVLLWVIYFVILVIDAKSLKKLLAKCMSENYNDAQIINAFSSYIKRHPLSLHNTDLIIKMISSLVAEKQDVMKWIKKINGKDIDPQFYQSLLFDYFVLSEYGYTEELGALFEATVNCVENDFEFDAVCSRIFEGSPIAREQVEEMEGKYYKSVALYNLFCEELQRGELDKGESFADRAIQIVPEKAMMQLVAKKKDEYEKDN